MIVGLLHGFPMYSSDDEPDGSDRYPIVSSNLAQAKTGAMLSSNFTDLVRRQFCHSVTFPCCWPVRMATTPTRLGGRRDALPRRVQLIFLIRSQKEMSGSYARRIIAMMAGINSFRNRPISDYPSGTVSGNGALEFSPPKLAIAARTQSACPNPTRPQLGTMGGDRSILVDFRPETLFGSGLIPSVKIALHRVTSGVMQRDVSASPLPSILPLIGDALKSFSKAAPPE